MDGVVKRPWVMPALVGIVPAIGAWWLAMLVAGTGRWPEATVLLEGRAILGVAGQADPSTLLAAYPPIPYLFLSLCEWIAAPFGVDSLALGTTVLAAGFVAAYATTLRRARFGMAAILLFVALLCVHPFFLRAIVRGPQMLLLIWGVWTFGLGLFGFRATGAVNDLLALSLSLPLMALTSVEGAVFAVAAIPFILLSVPPHLIQRAYGSVYLVLLFPLLFSALSMVVLASVLLHDPLGFLTPEVLAVGRWTTQPWWMVVGASIAVVIGTLMIAAALIVRTGSRRPLQSAAGALLWTMALAVAGQALVGLSDNALEALAPIVAAAAVVSARWPVERQRVLRSGLLLAIGLFVAISFMATNGDRREPLAAVIGVDAPSNVEADVRLGRFLADKQGVLIDAVAHPAVAASRGNADGLVTGNDAVFAVSMLSRRIFSPHVAVPAHRPGVSDDAIARTLPALHANGPPGYRLTYDDGGWRVWSRNTSRKELP